MNYLDTTIHLTHPVHRLRVRQCRWPSGSVPAGTLTFCCHPQVEGRTYCAEHLARSLRPAAIPESAEPIQPRP